MKISQILKRTGLEHRQIAQKLFVSVTTIGAWVTKNAIPRWHWEKLIQISDGAITQELLEKSHNKEATKND